MTYGQEQPGAELESCRSVWAPPPQGRSSPTAGRLLRELTVRAQGSRSDRPVLTGSRTLGAPRWHYNCHLATQPQDHSLTTSQELPWPNASLIPFSGICFQGAKGNMGEPGEPGQKGRQVSALPTPAHPEAPVPAAGVASTTLCSCTGRSRHRRPHWIPWTQGKLLLTLPGGWGHGDKPRASCLQEGPAMGSGCARHSPSPLPLTHGSEVPRYFQCRIIPGGTSPPEPADTPSSLPWTWWVGPSTLPTCGNASFLFF